MPISPINRNKNCEAKNRVEDDDLSRKLKKLNLETKNYLTRARQSTWELKAELEGLPAIDHLKKKERKDLTRKFSKPLDFQVRRQPPTDRPLPMTIAAKKFRLRMQLEKSNGEEEKFTENISEPKFRNMENFRKRYIAKGLEYCLKVICKDKAKEKKYLNK